jgi:Cu(I)/Ag(I) efflux system protein CusF
MKQLMIVLALAAAFAMPALGQSKSDDHAAHHPAAAAAAVAITEGEIRKVDKDASKLTIKHGEIKEF